MPSRRCHRSSRRWQASSGWRSYVRSPGGSALLPATRYADLCGAQIQNGRRGIDHHLFLQRGDAELDFDPFGLADAEDDLTRLRAEAGELDVHQVGAGAEIGDDIVAVAVADHSTDRAGRFMRDGNAHSRQRALALVEHAADNSRFGLLGRRPGGGDDAHEKSDGESESFHALNGTEGPIRRYDVRVKSLQTQGLRCCNYDVTSL